MIKTLLKENELSVYECSKRSGIPYTTLLEIVSGKTDLGKCSSLTVYKLAKTLNTTVEDLLENYQVGDFEVFKSNVKHILKFDGDIKFLEELYKSNKIRIYYRHNQKAKALYLLATADYLSRINNLPINKEYDDIRTFTLAKLLLPQDLEMFKEMGINKEYIENAIENAIPEFKRFNIIEGDLRDVV